MTTSSYALSAARTAAPGLTSTFYGRIDELASNRFAVDVEGLLVAVFTGCSGLSAEIEVETYQEGGLNDYEHKLPGRTSYGNISLTGGVGNSIFMWDWFHRAAVGEVRRRDISIVMYMRNNFEAMRWNLTGAIPVAWEGPEFDAESEEVTVHSLEIAHNGISLSPPALAVKALLMAVG
ncbi:MAG: phage tail protein [Chloroflexota bacterium]|nr:phage tail protein [Chloroflexota bacterium]MDE2844021.1 phage tail protein [Chloroflexota bacterium]